MARVLLLSDTHGFLDPRVAELAASCDYAVHAGDVGDEQVLITLAERTTLIAVRGNNDLGAKWRGSEHSLNALPELAQLDLPGGALVVVHGHRAGAAARRHQRLRRDHPKARAVVYGHSHRLVCDQEASPWVLNPGAAGRARTYGGPSCILVEADAERWQIEAVRFDR